MSHGPATEWKKDNSASVKSKLGIILFTLYALIYAGFIFINVFAPGVMGKEIGSINLAIYYGLGLIIFALVLAVIYNHYCTRSEEKMNQNEEQANQGGNIL